MGGDTRVAPLGRRIGCHQLNVDVKQLHRLGAPHIPRVGDEKAVQCRFALHTLAELSVSTSPLATRVARNLRRASNNTLYNALRLEPNSATSASSGTPI